MIRQWPHFVVLGAMLMSVSAIAYLSTDHRYDPKPARIASYVVHARSQSCLDTLMRATRGAYYGSTDIGQWLRLRRIAEGCGGSVELAKE